MLSVNLLTKRCDVNKSRNGALIKKRVINSFTFPNVSIDAALRMKTHGGVDNPLPIPRSCQLARYVLKSAIEPSGDSGSAPPEIAPNL